MLPKLYFSLLNFDSVVLRANVAKVCIIPT